jgi:hypothetical protein
MRTAKQIILWLAFILACFLPASALTSTASANCTWQIVSTGYDADNPEATIGYDSPVRLASTYDEALNHRAGDENRSLQGTCALFGSNAEFEAADTAGGAYSAIGSTGQVGENALSQLGGQPQAYFNTSLGGRYVDQLVNGIPNESKVGYQSLTPGIQLQVAKDVELMQAGKIDGSIWNFYRSPVTGKIGPSGPLSDFLNQNNIPVVLHY